MEMDEKMIQGYAKKIMGFAYSKTNNLQTAEDLSQEILLALSSSLRRQERIDNMDGFVYRICSYTWSKFLRSNKKHWNNIDIDAFFDLGDESSVEEDVQLNLMIEGLKQELAYLTRVHRDITLMFYYENKTGGQIADLLGIPHSTVRWHLSEIKKKLKVGIEMTNKNLAMKPKRLIAGHDGYISPDYHQCGLGQDRLVDNICIACYGNKLTIEEIARSLSVAAGYIERHIERLVYIDYLRVVDKNKYTTNFFIGTVRHDVLVGKYHYHNIGPYAERIHKAFEKRYDRIRAIGFLGNDLDKDFVLWALIPLAVNRLYYTSLKAVYKRNRLVIDTPRRKDGSQHWVCAWLVEDDYLDKQTEFSREELDFYDKSFGNGIKTRNNDQGLASLQLESKATIDAGYHWREFESQDLNELSRIANIITDGQDPNDLDKLLIAKQAESGYVKMESGKAKILIPYFTKDQMEELHLVLDEIYKELGEEIFTDYIESLADITQAELPDFISKEERTYLKYKAYPQYAILYWLADKGMVRYPTKEEAKRLCTVVWQEK
ncbi:MAG TPA: RNA polymerase sigma factor [Bacillota bacterium]|nr:RNA polymerase sigma factor [Bacillota bacterium]